jgi:hypothetical protein
MLATDKPQHRTGARTIRVPRLSVLVPEPFVLVIPTVQARAPQCQPNEWLIWRSIDETAKVMSYLHTRDVIAFIVRHQISTDWLLCGDLKGLLRTIRDREGSAR